MVKKSEAVVRRCFVKNSFLKETSNSYLCSSPKSSVNICLMKTLKNTVTEKVIVCFYDLGEKNLERKVAAFVIFPYPRMVFFLFIKGSKVCFCTNCAFPLKKACNFIKKETLTQVFSCEFCEIFKNPFL